MYLTELRGRAEPIRVVMSTHASLPLELDALVETTGAAGGWGAGGNGRNREPPTRGDAQLRGGCGRGPNPCVRVERRPSVSRRHAKLRRRQWQARVAAR